MACTLDTPCNGVLEEDVVFARDMASAGLRRRQFRCGTGHALTVAVKGRPRTRALITSRCPCGQLFDYYPARRGHVRVHCSVICARLFGGRRTLVPEQVARLYALGWSQPRIARAYGLASHGTVGVVLRRLGIVGRPRHRYAAVRCIEPGCIAAVVKHTRGRDTYGTRCAPHHREHERARALRWWRRHRGQGLRYRRAS